MINENFIKQQGCGGFRVFYELNNIYSDEEDCLLLSQKGICLPACLHACLAACCLPSYSLVGDVDVRAAATGKHFFAPNSL